MQYMGEEKKDENLELIYEEAKSKLKDQLLSVDQITTKFSIILGFNGVIAAVLIQKLGEVKDLNIFLGISLLMLIISIILGLIGIDIKKYRRDPDPGNLYEIYKSEKVSETKETLIQNFIEAYRENDKKLNKLIIVFRSSILITLGAIIFMFIYYLIGRC